MYIYIFIYMYVYFYLYIYIYSSQTHSHTCIHILLFVSHLYIYTIYPSISTSIHEYSPVYRFPLISDAPGHAQEILQDNEAEELKESRLRVNGWRGQVWGWGGGWSSLWGLKQLVHCHVNMNNRVLQHQTW